MFALQVKVEDKFKRVADAAQEAKFRNFGHAAASIRKDAISTIEKSEKASAPGSPPHTRRGQLPRAIRYAVDKDGAIIGPVASVVGESGAAHEFGGTYKGEDYPARPFMAPALERAEPRFAGDWQGSIGE